MRRRVVTWLRSAAPVAVFFMAVGLALGLLKWGPQLFDTENLAGKDRAEDLGRIRTAILAVLAGGLAALGAYYTHRTFALNRAGQITERFTRAIDQLGRPEVDVRLGGIYALERLARDSADDHPQVVEVLTAYVREHARARRAPRKAPGAPNSEGAPQNTPNSVADVVQPTALPTDVQAAMSVLGRRDRARHPPEGYLDLAFTDLQRVRLTGDPVHFEGASFIGASLQGAGILQAHFEEASFEAAHLEGAHLLWLHLEGADLTSAHLEGANLREAHLEGATLGSAQLEQANLAGTHLEGAFYDDDTTWPEGFDPKAAGAIWRS